MTNALTAAESILRRFGKSNPNSEKFEHDVAALITMLNDYAKSYLESAGMTLSMDLDDPAVIQILHEAGWKRCV